MSAGEFREIEGVTLTVDVTEGVLRLKAVGTFDEPVELTPEQARELARRLQELAERVD